MDNLIAAETNPWGTVALFGGYCFTGVTMLSYFAYRGFKSAEKKVRMNREAGQRLSLSKMGSIGGLYKAVPIDLTRASQLVFTSLASSTSPGTSISTIVSSNPASRRTRITIAGSN